MMRDECLHVYLTQELHMPVCSQVTHTALATKSVLERIAVGCPTPFGALMQQLLTFFADTYKQVFQFDDPPLHDPCAVAYVIAPELFEVGLDACCCPCLAVTVSSDDA
jgi:inosine-uridine nucleoside N-ribohydrolase